MTWNNTVMIMAALWAIFAALQPKTALYHTMGMKTRQVQSII
jgi:hypothetical protein